jgi:multidrug efflux pump subunit AcrA (membrane-fusion protein)
MKTILVTFLLATLLVPLVACNSTDGEAGLSENEVMTIERGNLAVDITAAGNLALSHKEDLAFEISGTEQDPLTVAEVLVAEGDSVIEGQVLVTVDASALEDKVATREQAVTTAELNLRTAEINLEIASDSYRKMIYPYSYHTFAFDIPAAIVDIHDAELQLEEVADGLQEGPGSEEYGEAWHQLNLARENLLQAREWLSWGQGVDVFLDESNTVLAVEDYWTLRAAEQSVEKSEISLEKAKDSLEEARDELDDARDELEKAVIVAPLVGFVTQVNVEGGDAVKKGTIAITIADPNRFEADIFVSEMDILQVQEGGEALVEVDALSGLSLPAEVTHISPTATIQSGVVNYEVKVEIKSMEAVAEERQSSRQEAFEGIAQGELPERMKQAVDEGSITREQAEEFIEQMQQQESGVERQGQVPAVMSDDFQLREGLTVTVSVIVAERNDVVLVPNSAITSQGGRSYVQVVGADENIEEREIETGISNWTHTEVIAGLSEGEQISVPAGTAATTTTESSQQRPPGGVAPGMGRVLR